MKKINFLKEEKKYWRRGNKNIVGLDEAGRGALAGPVVAAAVLVDSSSKIKDFKFLLDIKDSKKLTAKRRGYFYKILTRHSKIKWALGKVSEKTIDKVNILQATKLAMKKAVKNLENKLKNSLPLKKGIKNPNRLIDFLILDGKIKLNIDIPQKSIVKADEKVFSCMTASILAKVTRDKLMEKYHKKYPKYGFDNHKGYLTKHHQKMLKKYGVSSLHRQSFSPLK